MHPPSMYSFLTSKKAISLFIFLFIMIGLFFYGIASQTPKNTTSIILSPTPVALGWKSFTNETQQYTIQYPPEFKQTPESADSSTKTYTFTVNGQTYYFGVFAPGTGSLGPQNGDQVSSVSKNNIKYDGESFTRLVWYRNNKAFLIAIRPDNPSSLFYSFQMTLPPTDTSRYIQLFDQITTTLQIKR